MSILSLCIVDPMLFSMYKYQCSPVLVSFLWTFQTKMNKKNYKVFNYALGKSIQVLCEMSRSKNTKIVDKKHDIARVRGQKRKIDDEK